MSLLTKWPRLVVAGDPVTPEQADVILVRTRYPWVMSNDQAWQWMVEDVFRMPHEADRDRGMEEAAKNGEKYPWGEWFAQADAAWKALGVLQLNYLFNEQVESTWYGGPHGWCHWDGSIGCSSHNIGKWPTVDEVTQEWRMIAEAFPFLRLGCQVVTDEGTGVVAAQWRVEGGRVRQVEIGPLLRPLEDWPVVAFGDSCVERGVDLQRLRVAVERTVASLGGQ